MNTAIAPAVSAGTRQDVILAREGRRHKNNNPHVAGPYTRNDIFESAPSPTIAPSRMVRPHPGDSAHQSDATTAAVQNAVAAISVVTRPAWARTGGMVVKIRIATTAAIPPEDL